MRTFGSNIASSLALRKPVVSRLLFWITAMEYGTNTPHSLGFWDGDDHQNFTINSVSRLYYGAGQIMNIEDLTIQAGFDIKSWKVTFSGLSDEVELAIRQYNARFAPIEVHQVFFNPDNMNMLDTPEIVYDGMLNSLSFEKEGLGGSYKATLELTSDARILTQTLPLRRSDEAYKRRSGDRMFRYAAMTESTKVFWGQKGSGPVLGGAGGQVVNPVKGNNQNRGNNYTPPSNAGSGTVRGGGKSK